MAVEMTAIKRAEQDSLSSGYGVTLSLCPHGLPDYLVPLAQDLDNHHTDCPVCAVQEMIDDPWLMPYAYGVWVTPCQHERTIIYVYIDSACERIGTCTACDEIPF